MSQSLNHALKPFWDVKKDLKILKGGRSSSKTWDATGVAIHLASEYRLKFLCLRQFQNRIDESIYATLEKQAERFDLYDEFTFLKSTITHNYTGSEFHFYGIQRNIAEIKGFEGADICIIEEAEGLTKKQLSIIEPTLRAEGAELWLIYNPRLVSDFIETLQNRDDTVTRHINYDENPFLSSTMLRKIERLKKSDYEEYEHIYLGVPRSDDENVVIKRSWIEASIDAHIKLSIEPLGDKRCGFDVADSGKDLCSQIYARGILAYWGENWKAGEDELLQSCSRVYAKSIELESSIKYDSIGVGALCGSKFNDMNKEREVNRLIGRVSHSKFIAGGKVINPDSIYAESHGSGTKNKDFFSNLKAQGWWLVADRFRNTYNAVTKGEKFDDDELISISSNMPNLAHLISELSTPRRNFDKTGRVKVESKDDLLKRDVPSTNDADAFIMAYSPVEIDSFSEALKISLID